MHADGDGVSSALSGAGGLWRRTQVPGGGAGAGAAAAAGLHHRCVRALRGPGRHRPGGTCHDGPGLRRGLLQHHRQPHGRLGLHGGDPPPAPGPVPEDGVPLLRPAGRVFRLLPGLPADQRHLSRPPDVRQGAAGRHPGAHAGAGRADPDLLDLAAAGPGAAGGLCTDLFHHFRRDPAGHPPLHRRSDRGGRRGAHPAGECRRGAGRQGHGLPGPGAGAVRRRQRGGPPGGGGRRLCHGRCQSPDGLFPEHRTGAGDLGGCLPGERRRDGRRTDRGLPLLLRPDPKRHAGHRQGIRDGQQGRGLRPPHRGSAHRAGGPAAPGGRSGGAVGAGHGERVLFLPGGGKGPGRGLLHPAKGGDPGHSGPHRQRQDHAGLPSSAAVRRGRRHRLGGRPGREEPGAAGAGRPVRRGVPA